MGSARRVSKSRAMIVLLPFLLLWLVPRLATADEELFLALKCQLCHGVPAAAIEAKAKSAKVKGPDLGTNETLRTKEEVITYMRQETEIDGKEHKKEFKGTDEELQGIVDWLLELSRQATAEAGDEKSDGGDSGVEDRADGGP